jgi:hypothetical protein
MKNIHILSTDKPSRLWLDSDKSYNLHIIPTTLFRMQHIYITSNEEIKNGDWHFKNDKMVTKSHLIDNTCKKIILTTDQSLDGVQKIGDEFLEWFVKNPSCEEVEVELVALNEYDSEISVNSYGFEKFGYKLIIPKEEHKQETLEEAMIKNGYHDKESNDLWREGVEFGAKWQQERSYSEEDLLGAFEAGMMFIGEDKGSFKEWFEQFKIKRNDTPRNSSPIRRNE